MSHQGNSFYPPCLHHPYYLNNQTPTNNFGNQLAPTQDLNQQQIKKLKKKLKKTKENTESLQNEFKSLKKSLEDDKRRTNQRMEDILEKVEDLIQTVSAKRSTGFSSLCHNNHNSFYKDERFIEEDSDLNEALRRSLEYQ